MLVTHNPEKIYVPPKRKHTVILGMGLSTYSWLREVYRQPLTGDVNEYNVWGINHAAYAFKCTAAINMHDPDEMFSAPERASHRKALQRLEIPIVMPRAVDWLPQSREYPLHKIFNKFQENYFSNGVAYAVALAMLSGTEYIHLYGCDFDYPNPNGTVQSPYERGRACVEYWLGVASALGFKIIAPQQSTLLDMTYRVKSPPGLYGYGTRQPVFEADPAEEGKANLTGFVDPDKFQAAANSIEQAQQKPVQTGPDLATPAPELEAPIVTQHSPKKKANGKNPLPC